MEEPVYKQKGSWNFQRTCKELGVYKVKGEILTITIPMGASQRRICYMQKWDEFTLLTYHAERRGVKGLGHAIVGGDYIDDISCWRRGLQCWHMQKRMSKGVGSCHSGRSIESHWSSMQVGGRSQTLITIFWGRLRCHFLLLRYCN